MHAAHQYERVVRQLCSEVGITNSEEVISSRHLNLNDHLIGLVVDDEDECSPLFVYIQLGLTYPEKDLEIYHRMLKANIAARQRGFLCVHPESNQAVYQLRIDWRDMHDGAALAQLLAMELEVATKLFESVFAVA